MSTCVRPPRRSRFDPFAFRSLSPCFDVSASTFHRRIHDLTPSTCVPECTGLPMWCAWGSLNGDRTVSGPPYLRPMSADLMTFLEQFVTDDRLALFDRILDQRTRHLTVVVEEVFQSHNANAVVRSCECFGIQDMHVIEGRNTFDLTKGVNMGAAKWVDIHHHDRTADCIMSLKDQGFRVLATTPHTEQTIDQVDVSTPVAILFGTELGGLTETALDLADERARIPMVGFTESFNISVSAALVLQDLTGRLRQDPDVDWTLSAEERAAIRLDWIKKSIRGVDRHIRTFERP